LLTVVFEFDGERTFRKRIGPTLLPHDYLKCESRGYSDLITCENSKLNFRLIDMIISLNVPLFLKGRCHCKCLFPYFHILFYIFQITSFTHHLLPWQLLRRLFRSDPRCKVYQSYKVYPCY